MSLLERLTAKDPTLTELVLSKATLLADNHFISKDDDSFLEENKYLVDILTQLITNGTNPHISTFYWTTRVDDDDDDETTTTTVTKSSSAPPTPVPPAKLLWQALATCPHLEHCILQHCPPSIITAQQAKHLGQALSLAWPHLQTLDLANNPKLGPRGCKILAEGIAGKLSRHSSSSKTTKEKGSSSKLTVLDLSRTSIGHLGAQAMGLILPSSLKELRLAHNAVGHDGVWKLASPRLSQLKQLQILDLSWNACWDDGCLEISRHLPALKSLEYLSLAGNSITGTGVKGLARALSSRTAKKHKNKKPQAYCASLRRLDLSDNRIDAAGVVPLAKVLSSNSGSMSSLCCALDSLDLSGNQLHNAGCKALARGIVGRRSSSALDADMMTIGTAQSVDSTAASAVDDDDDGEWWDADEGSDDYDDDDEEGDDDDNDHDDLHGEDASSSHHTVDYEHDGVVTTSSLRVLKLARNQIGDCGVGTFVELLDDMPNVCVLDLSDNPDVSEARIRILTMLLKHRQATPLTPRTPKEGGGRRIVSAAATTADGNDNEGAETSKNDLSSRLSVPFSPQVADEYVYLARDLDPQAIRDGREDLLGLDIVSDDISKVDTAVHVHLDYMHFLTDHFNAKKILSHGTFGSLFPAKDDQVQEQCELVVRRLCLGPAGALKSARDTVLTELQDLRHKNFLPLLAMTTAGGPSQDTYCFLYNVTQLRPLRAMLQEKDLRRTLVWKLRIEILQKVAQALVFLHGGIGPKRKPCFHGDIQPSNIFVGPSPSSWDLRVQLTDGGLGRLLATDRGRFAAGDVVFGTRAYRCPRYERGSCHYDAASDMFSYGIVLSEVLTGCLQGSRTQKNTGMTNDFYYDNILLSNQQTTVKVDPLAGVLPRQAMEGLAQVGASCLSPVVIQRPAAHTVERILGQLKVE